MLEPFAESRDRLRGQPQERQRDSAAFRRDAGPTAPGERLKSDFATPWYQFCICDTVSVLRMSMPGVRMFTEGQFFKRGRHGQRESEEEQRRDRESHQEGGKEDVEKEIVGINDRETAAPDRNPDAKQISSKRSERPPAGVRVSRREQDKIRTTFVQTAAAA